MTEGKGRSVILFIHNSLPFHVYKFDVEFIDALFCTLKLKGEDKLWKNHHIKNYFTAPLLLCPRA